MNYDDVAGGYYKFYGVMTMKLFVHANPVHCHQF